MWKSVAASLAAVLSIGVLAWQFAGALMFREQLSPFGVEETAARIQQNIQAAGNGWALAGLRNPGKAIENDGGNTLPVLMVEACSTKYSAPILANDATRFLSILMPCKISVYKKSDGKVYIGTMNAELVGHLFGPRVGELMRGVARDQAKFVQFDGSKPAPPLITTTPGSSSSGSGTGSSGGC